MIQLEAFTPADGWAIAREGALLFLLRPPYQLSGRVPLTHDAARRLVTQDVMTLDGREFSSWGELTAAMLADRDRLAASIDADDRSQSATAVLRLASKPQLVEHFRAIEEEFLPRGRFDDARRVLLALHDAPSLQGDATLLKRLADLLIACGVARGHSLRVASDDPRLKWFGTPPSEDIQRLQDDIQGRGHVLKIAA